MKILPIVLFLLFAIFYGINGQGDLEFTDFEARTSPIRVNQPVNYSFEFENIGNESISDPNITVTYTNDVSFVNFGSLIIESAGYSISSCSDSHPFTCTINGTIDSSDSVSGSFTLTPLSTAAGRTLQITLELSANDEANTTNNDISVSSVVTGGGASGTADLVVTLQKSSNPKPSEPLFATVNVTNKGPDEATSLICIVDLPALSEDGAPTLLTVLDNDNLTCSQPDTNIPQYSCDLETLNVDNSVFIDITWYVPASFSGTASVKVSCTADQSDPSGSPSGEIDISIETSSVDGGAASSLSSFLF